MHCIFDNLGRSVRAFRSPDGCGRLAAVTVVERAARRGHRLCLDAVRNLRIDRPMMRIAWVLVASACSSTTPPACPSINVDAGGPLDAAAGTYLDDKTCRQLCPAAYPVCHVRTAMSVTCLEACL
jgi:hypothetical protein